MGKGIGGHTRAHRGATDDWITPRHIVGALGRFDLDPCACIPQPWPCADTSYNLDDDGLAQPWTGRVWLNPVRGPSRFWRNWRNMAMALPCCLRGPRRSCSTGNICNTADALLFLKGRLYFHRPDGTRAPGNVGGPSVLIAYGHENVSALRDSGLDGAFVELSRPKQLAGQPQQSA